MIRGSKKGPYFRQLPDIRILQLMSRWIPLKQLLKLDDATGLQVCK